MSEVGVYFGNFKAGLDAMTDEVLTSSDGKGKLLIHHISGSLKNKFVLGSERPGKSVLPDRINKYSDQPLGYEFSNYDSGENDIKCSLPF